MAVLPIFRVYELPADVYVEVVIDFQDISGMDAIEFFHDSSACIFTFFEYLLIELAKVIEIVFHSGFDALVSSRRGFSLLATHLRQGSTHHRKWSQLLRGVLGRSLSDLAFVILAA